MQTTPPTHACVLGLHRDFLEGLSVAELKKRLALMSLDSSKCVEKSELVDMLATSEETLIEKPGPSWDTRLRVVLAGSSACA